MNNMLARKKSYKQMILTMNGLINEFNGYLSSKNPIPGIDVNRLDNEGYFTNLSKYTWSDLQFPNSGSRGVYFIFGYSEAIQKESLYIGKASFNSSIGKRMVNHLKKDKNNENYYMYDLNGNNHILEYVASIDLDSPYLQVFSSSLEEYLISGMKEKFLLLNGTGNRT